MFLEVGHQSWFMSQAGPLHCKNPDPNSCPHLIAKQKGKARPSKTETQKKMQQENGSKRNQIRTPKIQECKKYKKLHFFAFLCVCFVFFVRYDFGFAFPFASPFAVGIDGCFLNKRLTHGAQRKLRHLMHKRHDKVSTGHARLRN